MEVRILGPLEVEDETGPLSVPTPKERAVLEVLALRTGEVVPTEVLIDALWGIDPPRSASKSLQSHVSRLRRALPTGAIATDGAGYRLDVLPEDVDAHRFERLVSAGRQAADGSDHRRAVSLLDRGLDLWRGTPLTELADGSLRIGQTVRLAELHLAAAETRVDAHLALGHHEQMVPELEALVADHPLRERFWWQLMLALYRSDRRADALAAFQRLRVLLRDDLGIDPSSEVRELESRIIREDPDLPFAFSGPPSSIPKPLSSFVGRVAQRREVGKLLREHRLVTLLGPGGVGKTRLAIAVGEDVLPRTEDGVWWVDATNAEGSGNVAVGLAKVLGVAVPPGVTVTDSLRHYLAPRKLLVIVDNAERIAEDVGRWFVDLLEAAPDVTALVTSRVPLRVPGEQRYTVPPLELPDDELGIHGECESVQLFLDRLSERRHGALDEPEPSSVAPLCGMADGLPLGIELLASRAGALGPSELADRLDHRRNELLADRVPGRDERHASLDIVLASTVELLEPPARDLFGRLSVFTGSFDRTAARAVAGSSAGDGLEDLADAALLQVSGVSGATRRYRFLETTRAYAMSQVDASEARDAAARHAEHYRDLVRRAGAAMLGPNEQEWVDRLHLDDANIRTALRWWHDHEPVGVLAFANGIGRAWYVWNDLAETRDALDEMLTVAEQPGVQGDPLDVAWLHQRLCWPRFLSGDFAGGMAEAEEAIECFRDLDDPAGLAVSLGDRAQMTVFAEADTDAALEFYRPAIRESRRAGSPELTAWILAETAQALIFADRVDEEVHEMLDQAQPPLEAAGDLVGLAHVCMDRTLAAYAEGDLEEADAWAQRGIDYSRAAGHAVYEQVLLLARGVGDIHRGDQVRSLELIEQSARIAYETHNLYQLGLPLQALAARAATMDRPVDSARMWGAAGTLTPVWPLFRRRYYDELMAPAREALGPRWEDEVAAGAALTVEEALELALADGSA